MELRVLKYFLAVAREENITKAAELLHITQPTLSKQLMELEEEIGKKLLIRGNRKTTLTKDGVFLRKRAEEIIDLVSRTEKELEQEEDTVSGDIYIGAGETDSVRLLIKAYKRILDNNHDIRLHISSGDSIDVLYDLDKGLVDFGLVLGDVDVEKYDFIPLPAVDTWGVLMNRKSELADREYITPKDLADKPIIISRQAKSKKEMNSWFNGEMDRLNIIATNNLVFNASLMAEEEIGYVVALDKLINTSNSNLKFIPLKPRLTIDIKLIWKKYRALSKPAELFLKEVETIIVNSEE